MSFFTFILPRFCTSINGTVLLRYTIVLRRSFIFEKCHFAMFRFYPLHKFLVFMVIFVGKELIVLGLVREEHEKSALRTTE